MCLAQVGAWGSATRTSGTSSIVEALPHLRGLWSCQEGAGRQVVSFWQGPCQEREALPGEAYRSPTFSFSGPLLLGLRRDE